MKINIRPNIWTCKTMPGMCYFRLSINLCMPFLFGCSAASYLHSMPNSNAVNASGRSTRLTKPSTNENERKNDQQQEGKKLFMVGPIKLNWTIMVRKKGFSLCSSAFSFITWFALFGLFPFPCDPARTHRHTDLRSNEATAFMNVCLSFFRIFLRCQRCRKIIKATFKNISLNHKTIKYLHKSAFVTYRPKTLVNNQIATRTPNRKKHIIWKSMFNISNCHDRWLSNIVNFPNFSKWPGHKTLNWTECFFNTEQWDRSDLFDKINAMAFVPIFATNFFFANEPMGRWDVHVEVIRKVNAAAN